MLAGCFTTYRQAWNLGGPIAISWGWPIVCIIVLTVAFEHGGGGLGLPDRRRAVLVGERARRPGLVVVHGLVQPDRPDRHRGHGRLVLRSSFATTVFNLWDLDFILNFADAVSLEEIFIVFVVILGLHALINIYSSHLVALFNNISVFWHCVGVVIIIAILIIVPDKPSERGLRLHGANQQLRILDGRACTGTTSCRPGCC